MSDSAVKMICDLIRDIYVWVLIAWVVANVVRNEK